MKISDQDGSCSTATGIYRLWKLHILSWIGSITNEYLDALPVKLNLCTPPRRLCYQMQISVNRGAPSPTRNKGWHLWKDEKKKKKKSLSNPCWLYVHDSDHAVLVHYKYGVSLVWIQVEEWGKGSYCVTNPFADCLDPNSGLSSFCLHFPRAGGPLQCTDIHLLVLLRL